MDYLDVDLTNINKGAAIELFQEELGRVLDNIADPNTKPDATREIQLVVKLTPNKDRTSAKTVVYAQSKLAGVQPHEHFVIFGTDGKHPRALVTNPNQNILEFEEQAAQEAAKR